MRSICAATGGVLLMFPLSLAAAGIASAATANVTGGIAHASDFTTQNDMPFGGAPSSGSVSVNGPAFHASANFAALTDRVTLAATESVNATGAGSPGGYAQLDPVNFTVPVATPFSVFATLDWTNAASSSIPTSLRAYFRLFANNAEAAFDETFVTANPGQHASLTDFPLLTGTLTPGVNYSFDTSLFTQANTLTVGQSLSVGGSGTALFIVPEPTTAALMLAATPALLVRRRR